MRTKGISGAGIKRLARSYHQSTVDEEVWNKIDHLREMLGDDEFIMAWIKASSTEEAMENADFIIQTYDIPMGVDEEEY